MSDFDLFDRHRSENFSTSLVAFSMKRSPRFAALAVRQIFDRAIPKIGPVKTLRIDEVEREYPITLRDGSHKRLDLMVSGQADGANFVIAIEAKINADFSLTQIKDYREWVDSRSQELRVLAILTKQKYYWDNEPDKPHAELRWSELGDWISEFGLANSEFERGYWEQLRLHVEDMMRTFEGFKTGSCDVYALMQDVQLFLERLFEEMKVTRKGGWRDYYAAYYAPELSATVGFYWWRSQNFFGESQPNQFCIWKDGDKQAIPLGVSLEDVVRGTQDPKQRDQYISELAARVLKVCAERAKAIAV